MLTIKEYAEARGKSVQAVYKQMQRKSNRSAVREHTGKEVRGGKLVTVLDDEAVRILDAMSAQSPVVIEQTTANEELDRLRAEKERLQELLIQAQSQIIDLREKTAEQQLLLAGYDKMRKELSEAQEGLMQSISDIEAERSRAEAAEATIEVLRARTLWQRILNK